tara:strand:+ start:479 stop:640 length:162 start_codon:yes stop_codon:yes gene_type:complete
MISSPVHTHKPDHKNKRCWACMGKGETTIKLSTGATIGPNKCHACKGTGKIKK